MLSIGVEVGYTDSIKKPKHLMQITGPVGAAWTANAKSQGTMGEQPQPKNYSQELAGKSLQETSLREQQSATDNS